MTDRLVLVDVADGIGTLTMNRAERHNAVSDELSDEWAAKLYRLISDLDVRVILLRGEGRSFCSGRDTQELGRRARGESDLAFVRRAQQVRVAMLEAPKPIVAAVNGFALGLGFEIALAADMRVAADDAVFALPEIDYGLLPDTGGTQLLIPLAGPSRAKYLVMSGARIDAAQAGRWGIVDFVVPREQLDAAARKLCGQLAAKSPTAVSVAKQLVDHAQLADVRSGLGQELLAQTVLFKSEEYLSAKAALRAGDTSVGGGRSS